MEEERGREELERRTGRRLIQENDLGVRKQLGTDGQALTFTTGQTCVYPTM